MKFYGVSDLILKLLDFMEHKCVALEATSKVESVASTPRIPNVTP